MLRASTSFTVLFGPRLFEIITLLTVGEDRASVIAIHRTDIKF